MKILRLIGTLVLVSLALQILLSAQGSSGAGAAPVARAGTVERIKVHGKSLEGNLEGDSSDRDVAVYLPPGYAKNRHRHYPVVYFLHGYTQSADKWYGPAKFWAKLPDILNQAFAEAGNHEMIFVTPDAFTRYQGSFYSNSVTTGNWEDYIVRELVPYIDSHYRTIAERSGRGLAGHSMGGYGAMRIGMRHPDVFSSVYLLSACCMKFSDSYFAENGGKAETAKTPEEAIALEFNSRLIVALAAAWSPDPKNPPLFFDLPVKDGKPAEEVVAKFHANQILDMIDQYIANLRQLRAIAFDVGTKDAVAPGLQRLDRVLTSYGIAHQSETYEGDHVNHIADRIETKVVPFFSQHLAFDVHYP